MEIRIREESFGIETGTVVDIAEISFDTTEEALNFLRELHSILAKIKKARIDEANITVIYDQDKQEVLPKEPKSPETNVKEPQADQPKEVEEKPHDDGYFRFNMDRFQKYRGTRVNSRTKEAIIMLLKLIDRDRAYKFKELQDLLKKSGYPMSKNTLYDILETMFSMGYVSIPRYGMYKFMVTLGGENDE